MSAHGQGAAAHPLGLRRMPPEEYMPRMMRLSDPVLASLPRAYDARSKGIVTPAKDQGQCGSCWAFAATGALESHVLAAFPGGSLDLSEQQLVSCDRSNFGCDGGYLSSVRFWEDHAPVPESCFRYTGNDATACAYGCGGLPYRVLHWHTVADDTAMYKASCYADGPGPFAFEVYADFFDYWDQAAPGSVYRNVAGGLLGGHAVLLIGWDDVRGAFLCKNSWGSTGGPNHDGTFWMAYSGHRHDLGFQMVNFDVGSVGAPAVIGFDLDGGAATSADLSVRLNSACVGNPTRYMASESPTFAGASWQTYSASTTFKLSEGRGTKKVYFKVANATAQSPVVTDSIRVVQSPAVTRFAVDAGNGITHDRRVVLSSVCSGSPTQYVASESGAFEGATWQTYSPSANFVLSSGAGTKRVYFKVRNEDGVSAVVSDSIQFLPPPTIASFAIDHGNASTHDRRVTLETTCAGSPTHYLASESASFVGASWHSYSPAPAFTLSAGNGVKRIYIKVRNGAGESSVVSDMIRLQ